MDKYHCANKPANETGANEEAIPKEAASPKVGEPPGADSNGSSRRSRKAAPLAVKAGKTDSPMQGIGKK